MVQLFMYVLSVFSPQYRKKTSDRFIEIPDREILEKKHRILSMMFRRLEAATNSSEINTAVEIEMEYEKFIESTMKEAAFFKEATENERKAKEQAEQKAEQERKAKEQAQAQAEQAELEKQIFRLYFIEKQSFEQISKTLNITVEFVKNTVSG